jgi:anaerobic ribonucleoside-triphosphate reductase activating protein
MADELTLLIDSATGTLLVEGPDQLTSPIHATLDQLMGPSQTIGCAAPLEMQTLLPATDEELAQTECVRIVGFWHNSLIEGPGRRTVVKLQGCPIRCLGCITPETWDASGGFAVPVGRLADVLLDPGFARDGITILGGEPFSQPAALHALIGALRSRGCSHVLCYSGYTYDALRLRSRFEPAVGAVLDEIDMLIDGPYISTLADGAGPWTGSSNQRVLTLKTALSKERSATTEA